MTTLLAGLAGAGLIVGLLLFVLGWQRTTPRPRRSRATQRPTRTGWARHRWTVAGVVGVALWAVSGWPVAGLLGVVAVVGLPVLLSTSTVAAQQIDRVEAIEEWTRRLADVVLTGTGLEQAIAATARATPAALENEVGTLLARLSARWPTEQALRAFADDLHDAAGDLVVAALVLASRRRGPGLARVLTSVADSVAEDVAARRRIEAERATPRTTARAVTLISLGVAGVGLLNGTYLEPYGTPVGQLALAVIAGGFIGCLVWMRALTSTPPEPRFLTDRPQFAAQDRAGLVSES